MLMLLIGNCGGDNNVIADVYDGRNDKGGDDHGSNRGGEMIAMVFKHSYVSTPDPLCLLVRRLHAEQPSDGKRSNKVFVLVIIGTAVIVMIILMAMRAAI